jgi:hypothetical protein
MPIRALAAGPEPREPKAIPTGRSVVRAAHPSACMGSGSLAVLPSPDDAIRAGLT